MKILTTKFTAQADSEPSKFCIFSHYDSDGRLERYVIHYLDQLHKAGYEVVLVSTSPSLSASDVDVLSRSCHTVCLRENVGYDFGSFRAGIQLLKVRGSKVDRLLVANDSVFGPFNDLQPLLRMMEREDVDLYGLTDSHDHGYHLQSYFISYSARVYESPIFDDFWSSVDLISNSTDNFKQKIVHNYEVGGSQHFIRAGCTYAVAFSFRDVMARVFGETLDRLEQSQDFNTGTTIHPHELVFNLNASHRYWDVLLDMGMPFIKRELLTKNPTGADVSSWPQKIAAISDYDPSMILETLINQGYLESIYSIDVNRALKQIENPDDSFEVHIHPSLEQWVNDTTIPATVRFIFDDDFYLNTYQDVAAVVKVGDYRYGLEHFKRFGFKEGRKCAFKRVERA